jgi:hypothetical protein
VPADEESLRSSIASFAAANPSMKISVFAPLPESPSHEALTRQLGESNAAVSQVIQQTPGTPF